MPQVQRTRTRRRGSPRRLAHALEHTLAMSTATTEGEIFDHALTAVCEIAPADVGVVPARRRPVSPRRPGPRPGLGRRRRPRPLDLGRAGGMTSVRRRRASVGDDRGTRWRDRGRRQGQPGLLDTGAGSLLALLVAHAGRPGPAPGTRPAGPAGRQRPADRSSATTGPFEERLAASAPGRTAVIAVDVDDSRRSTTSTGTRPATTRCSRWSRRCAPRCAATTSSTASAATSSRSWSTSAAPPRSSRSPAACSRRPARSGHTVSVGAAVQLPGETGRETLLRADKALYQAKRAGRNTARHAA